MNKARITTRLVAKNEREETELKPMTNGDKLKP